MRDRDVELIARVAHQANRAYCQALGDEGQPPWDEAPDWQKESARAGVRAYLANPHLTAKETHELWLDHKRREGWRLGAVKDASKKTHPCFLPYEDLPVKQRAKDFIFGAIVRELLDQSAVAPPGIA